MQALNVGDTVNIEFDLIGKYVERQYVLRRSG
jgi:riboflavin synthase alpha subunit